MILDGCEQPPSISGVAVLWDVDGTLISSEELHLDILLELCAGFGPNISLDQGVSLSGHTPNAKWKQLNRWGRVAISREEWFRLFNLAYGQKIDSNLKRTRPVETVRRLHSLGVPQACVSNGDPEVVEANLKALDLADCFKITICNGDYSRGKPDPAPYSLACQRLGVKPDRCLAVEDSPLGVCSALGAGMAAVAWPADPEQWSGSESCHLVTNDEFPWHLLDVYPATAFSGRVEAVRKP